MNEFTIRICNACLELRGQMCHNPECAFIRRTTAEISNLLDLLLIRPIVNGKQLPVLREESK